MARTKMNEEERKAKAVAYSVERGRRLREMGACGTCAQVIGSGTKVSLRPRDDASGPAPEDVPVAVEPTAKPKRQRSKKVA